MINSILDFQDLKVWQKAIGLAKEVYLLTRRFPSDEKFGLTAQLRRMAAVLAQKVASSKLTPLPFPLSPQV